MGQPVRQSAFTGEIAPERYGRTNDPRYATSLRTCKNFIPIEDGALVNRAGTYHVGALLSASVRFEAFVFTDTQAFVLEFTAGLIRIWTPYGLVLNAGIPVSVVTPYVAADLPFLKFQQSGDVITILRRGYQPRDLTRVSNTNWTLALRSFSPQAAFFSAAPFVNPDEYAITTGAKWNSTVAIAGYAAGDVRIFQPGGTGPYHLYRSNIGLNHSQPDVANWTDFTWIAGTAYDKGKYVWKDGQPYISIIEQNTGNDPATAGINIWAPASDATRPASEWQWNVTVLWKDDHGITRETLPALINLSNQLNSPVPTKGAIFSDRPATVRWGTPGAQAFNFKLVGYNIYRGRNGLYGFVGGADATTTSFIDIGAAPDYGTQPPKGTNPFAVADGADSANTFSWPGAGTVHDQREVFAGTDKKPSTFFGSATGDFSRFDVYDPPQDADTYEWRVSSKRLEDIRSVVSFGRLLLFSGQGVFSANGASGAGITANSVEVLKHFKKGVSYLEPLEIVNVLLFNTSKGNYVRDLYYDRFGSVPYAGQDLTRVARHLFRGHTIVSWAHQQEPYSLVWIVREDGLLISCTYDKDTQTLAWAQHPTAGTVLQVETIPDGTEDAVMLAVLRNGTPRMERLVSRDLAPTDNRFLCFLDAAIWFDGRNLSSLTMNVSGASYNAEDVVTIDASSGQFVDPTDIGDQIVILPDGIPAVVDQDGNVVTAAVPATRATVTQVNSATQVLARLEAPLPLAYQNIPTPLWGWARDSFAGFDHLEGLAVTVLADGSVQGPFTVASGIIALLNPPALILVGGLPYTSDAELLDVAADAVKSNVKTVEQVIFEVQATRGILVGERLDDPAHPMRQAKLRKLSDNFDPTALVSQQVEVKVSSSWNTKGGRAAIRQKDPLPLTITAVTRIIEVGGTP